MGYSAALHVEIAVVYLTQYRALRTCRYDCIHSAFDLFRLRLNQTTPPYRENMLQGHKRDAVRFPLLHPFISRSGLRTNANNSMGIPNNDPIHGVSCTSQIVRPTDLQAHCSVSRKDQIQPRVKFTVFQSLPCSLSFRECRIEGAPS